MYCVCEELSSGRGIDDTGPFIVCRLCPSNEKWQETLCKYIWAHDICAKLQVVSISGELIYWRGHDSTGGENIRQDAAPSINSHPLLKRTWSAISFLDEQRKEWVWRWVWRWTLWRTIWVHRMPSWLSPSWKDLAGEIWPHSPSLPSMRL